MERTSPVQDAGVPRGRAEQVWTFLDEQLARLAEAGIGADGSEVRVLDCGGGSGSLAVPLARRGAQVTVIDVSLDALGTLVRRASEAGVADRVVALQGDAESVASLVPVSHFGLVLAHDVLGSVTAAADAVAGLAGALVSGGILSVVVSNPVSTVLARVLAGDIDGARAVVDRGADDTVGSLLRDCAAVGLTVDSVSGLGVFTDLMSGAQSENLGFAEALAELETVLADRRPYRDIASKIHVLARRVGDRRTDGS